jgi:adenylate cyclase
MPEAIRTTLAVLLHADVVGSTRLVQSGEVEAHTSMCLAFLELTNAVEARNGVVHEIRGDALVAQCPRPSDAVQAALTFQEQRSSDAATTLEASALPLLRIGIAMGEVVIADGTITGAGVVLAQRLEQLAPAGGVCVSEAVREVTPSHIPCRIESLGSQQLKGFDTAVTADLLSVDAEPAVRL